MAASRPSWTSKRSGYLVCFCLEHQLRSPVHAGFRPGQSPIHHLFALRHFIDTARISRRPLYACLVDHQKAYDSVQHPWCSFGWGHILCLLSKAGLLGLASPAISVDATFAALRLLAMNFITFFTALVLVPSGLSIPICFRMLKAPCVCSCGIRTKRLLAIASQPFCKWPRHEHRSVLISQAG